MATQICQACGFEVPEGARFCPSCGKEIVATQVCQACGSEVPERARFCPSCGKEVVAALPRLVKEHAPRRGCRRRALLVVLVVVAVLVIFVGARALLTKAPPDTRQPTVPAPRQPAVTEISASENAALWAEAHTALARFVGEGMKMFVGDQARSATQEEMDQAFQLINDFNRAVQAVENVTPPPEQEVMHRTLLPIYREMHGQMMNIMDALFSGDELSAELGWHRLALLMDKAGSVTAMLTLEPAAAPTTAP